jgi:hypothetical protein
MKRKGYQWSRSWANLKYCHKRHLDRRTGGTKNVTQDTQSQGQDLKQNPPKHGVTVKIGRTPNTLFVK